MMFQKIGQPKRKVLDLANPPATNVVKPTQASVTHLAPSQIVRLTITLPLPAAALRPNSRCCWQAKSRAVKKARADAKHSAQTALGKHYGPVLWERATIQPTFYVSRRGRLPDGDNCNASLKSYIDGLADSGIVANDSQFTLLPPIIERSDNPRISLEITPITELPERT